jgi:hypothetical protein
LFSTNSLRYRLFLCSGLQILIQFIGVNAVAPGGEYLPAIGYYIFGMRRELLPHASVVIQTLLLIGSVGGLYYIDRVGRRQLLLYGLSISVLLWIINIVCLLTIQYSIFDGLYSYQLLVKFCGILSMLFFVITFGSTLLISTWVYCHELFPLRVRSRASALATFCYIMSSELSVKFLSEYESYPQLCLGSFLLFALLSWVLVFLFYPEMSRLRLESVDDLFSFSSESSSCCPLLGFKISTSDAKNESIPLIRGRGAVLEAAISPSIIKTSFEPEKLHKYSNSLQSLDFHYMT